MAAQLSLTPAVVPAATFTDAVEPGPIRVRTRKPVANHQRPVLVTSPGSVAFEVDEYGNWLGGPNLHVPSRSGTDDFAVPDLAYLADKRTLYARTVKIATIADPPDLTLGRAGPANGTIDSTPVGVKNGNCLGQIHFKGYTTPLGGTVGVTAGGGWNADSVVIQAFATEDFVRDKDGNYQQGGELRVLTTPNLSATPVTRLTVREDGTVQFHGNARLRTVGASTPTGGADGDVVKGDGKLWVNDRGAWKYIALTAP